MEGLLASADWDVLSSYAGLLSLACFSIYCGSYGSISERKKSDKKKDDDADDEDDEKEEEPDEVVTMEDAWLFPVIGSVVLFGLFLVIKYFGKEWINWLLGWYFSLAGVGSVFRSSIALAKVIVGNERWKAFEKIQLSIVKGKSKKGADMWRVSECSPLLSISWRTPSTLLFLVSIIPSALYRFSSETRRSVLLTDILALSFSHNAMSLLKLDSFKTGCVLLSGLFLYDIYWVFGTRVMVEVATTLDVPIKLLWPKSVNLFSDGRGYTMLGLGDVVIPGVFVALALRYDYHRSPKSTPWFFYGTLVAYVLGLGTTMMVVHVFKRAQPALLYLSPGCIAGFAITGFVRGELAKAWNWKAGQP
ncbi:hypothetical protein VNI00_007414 [Paramarasmius palmivorus]|uniref:Minor histocompatibility antigen H13 n=1 Tax=Paramarasmius palmivorus TaxID=297713 RepID=A0AAW0D684_9AGAR